uniref:Ribonuclease H-like domain-containing protein n=1 Tax=Tanacetum cinerariifolium TaxID=118510 RepID=A0A6L2JB92_TANCI|nr:ribonuclease H-like domain-containing protein [Tanacetum cinerariifolium]
MKMEQYLAHTYYALWEVILNGNSAVQMTKDKAGNEIEVLPVTAQQILARIRERRAKSTLLMAIPDEHLARFHGIKDAKTLWAGIKTRFGGNAESKKMQKNILKQQFEICSVFLLKMQIKNSKISTFSLEQRSSGSSSNSQNVAFVSAKSIDSTNEHNVAYSVSFATCHKQINQDDLEEIDFKWQMAMLSMRVKRFYKKTRRKLDCRSARNSGNRSRDAGNAWYIRKDNGKRPAKEGDENALVVQDGLGTYDWSYQVEGEATNFALMAFTSNSSSSSSSISEFHEKEVLDIRKEEVTKTVFDNRLSGKENSLANDRFKKGEGYHAVLPPLTGNYMPHKPDLSFARLDDSIYMFKISDTITSLAKNDKDAPETSTASVEKPKEDRSSTPPKIRRLTVIMTVFLDLNLFLLRLIL